MKAYSLDTKTGKNVKNVCYNLLEGLRCASVTEPIPLRVVLVDVREAENGGMRYNLIVFLM